MRALDKEAATPIERLVRESGVKDTLAQPIINNLIKLGNELRKRTAGKSAHSTDEVRVILATELEKVHSKGGVINPLLDMDGTLFMIRG